MLHMSIQMQNYIVYIIVGATALQLIYPLIKQLFSLGIRHSKEQPPGLYAEICSKCVVKE